MREETKVTCPRCESELTVLLANQRHCNSCGNDFAVDRNPIATRAQAARADARGWPVRKTSH
jgi:transposase-like protein